MIRIQQLKLSCGQGEEELYRRAAKILRLDPEQIIRLTVRRRSIDARKKPDIFFSYAVDIEVAGISEEKCAARCHDPNVALVQEKEYRYPPSGSAPMREAPVIIGSGPAGLFCAWVLAECGYCPILLERGADVRTRQKDVEAFWRTGRLDPESNVSFGEGGAGTFSDGKLNTLVRDRDGRSAKVLSVFAENGAPGEILYDAKPHIGTDVLAGVIENMRNRLRERGASVRFGCRADGLVLSGGRVTGVRLADGSVLPAGAVVLAAGHSARDTFSWLYELGAQMQAKDFAVGLRVEHPQELINEAQYAMKHPRELPPAVYKLAAKGGNGRGVYSFCMCPGGWVVNASSEAGRLVTNGMSYHARDGANANSAVIVAVTPEDYGAKGPLAGIAFQRRLEELAFRAGAGCVPVERYGDFAVRSGTGRIGADFSPCIRGDWKFADVASILPDPVYRAFCDGMERFGQIIPGFDDENALVSGVESRTSSPVRICRDETLQSNLRGLYPCGEGAGYAGGIVSAAMDGIRVAEAIIAKYAPPGKDG